MTTVIPVRVVPCDPELAKRLEKFEAKERRRKLLHRIIWTVPATLAILAFVAYTETSDTTWPNAVKWYEKRAERVRAWWMSTFHDDRRG